ncbi:MAG TPA: MaoC/PaaZ C-terminal domain-containing protein [Gaiellaceae bacterium]
MTQQLRFRDVSVGLELDGFTQDVSQEFIDRYAVASLDLNPVHIDPEWASRAQVFGKPETVLHGMATMSLMASLVTRNWGATAQIRKMRSKFTKPVWVGQPVTFKGMVKEIHRLTPGHNYVVVEVTATDSEGDLVGLCAFDVNLPG